MFESRLNEKMLGILPEKIYEITAVTINKIMKEDTIDEKKLSIFLRGSSN